MTVPRLSLLLPVVATLAGSGCNGLSFDRQAMVFSFARERPEIRVLLIYDGLRVRGEKPDDLKLAEKQCRELFVDHQEFWFGVPELHFRLSLRAPRPGDDNDAFSALLRQLVTIDRVELFTDGKGRLCAYQTLTVRDPAKLVAEINKAITADVAAQARAQLSKPAALPEGDTDRATWRLIEQACRGKWEWIRMEPGRFSLTMPASPEYSRRVKTWILGLENLAELETAVRGGNVKLNESADPIRMYLHLRAHLGDLADMPWSFDQRADQFTIAIGYGGGEPIRVLPRPRPAPPPTELDKDLLLFARRLEVPFRKRIEETTVIEEFLSIQRPGRVK